MCMYLDKKATREFRAKIRDAGGTITCWKMYAHHGRGGLCPRYFDRDRVVVAGDIVSNRLGRAVGRDKVDEVDRFGAVVNRGIHVWCSRSVAQSAAWRRGCSAVAVRCQLKDFVGAGDDRDAVFMKVHLSKRSYAAALRSA